jgi:hypothetical protein
MMFEPYPHVFALHVAVILGGFLIGAFGAPVWALAALVIGQRSRTCSLPWLLRRAGELRPKRSPR